MYNSYIVHHYKYHLFSYVQLLHFTEQCTRRSILPQASLYLHITQVSEQKLKINFSFFGILLLTHI